MSGRSLVVSTLLALVLAAALLTVGQSARAGRRALSDGPSRLIAGTGAEVTAPENLPACHPMTHIYSSLSAGPVNSPIMLSFSSDPNPAFDGFDLRASGGGIEEGGGYPRPLQVLLRGTVGQKESFTLVRDYKNGDTIVPTCVSARAFVTITSGAVKKNPPPPPATPILPRCPAQVAASLTPAHGPSGTPTTLHFAKPAHPWEGYWLNVSSGGLDQVRRESPPTQMHFIAKGEHHQKIAYTLVREYLNGSLIEPTCIAAKLTFTIS